MEEHTIQNGTAAGRDRRIAWSAGMGLFQRVAQAGSTLVLMPLLLRVLGPANFGIWGAAASLAWLTTLLDIGTGAALVTLVARSTASENHEEARRHLAGALTFGCGLALLMLVVALGAMLAGISEGIGGVYLIAVVGLALNVPLNAANNVWMALQEGYVAALWELVQTLLTLGGLIAAAGFSRNLLLYVAIVYAALVLSNLGSLVHLLIKHRELRPHSHSFSVSAAKSVAGEGVLYFLLGVTGGLSFFLDNILTLELLGPEASAAMTIAMRICMSAVGILLVLSQPLWPAFTEAAERADQKWIRRALLRGSGMMVCVTGVGSAILIVYGKPLLKYWLHTDLGIDTALLIAISVWIVAQAISRVPALLLNALSIVRYQIVVYMIATTLALALKFALARRIGISGISWATTITILVIVIPAALARIQRWAKQMGTQHRFGVELS